MRTFRGVVLLVLAQGMAACDSSRPSTPIAPTHAAPPVQHPSAILDTVVDGYVYDSVFKPVAGAVVEVLDGPQAGLSATTGATGEFRLTGTASFDDTTRFRASSAGHVDSTGTLVPRCATCRGARYIYLVLGVVAPPVEIAGQYSLTFVADRTCTDLPSNLRTRTYNATITADPYSHSAANTSFQVTISGAQFLKCCESFFVGVEGNLVAFELRGEGPFLVEEAAPNTYIGFDGRAEASVSTSRVSALSTAFQGRVDYCALTSPMVSPWYDCPASLAVAHAECESQNHQLMLTRR